MAAVAQYELALLAQRAERVINVADGLLRSTREIRDLPETDCDGRCSGHLRRGLPYSVVQCDDCSHVVQIIEGGEQ